MGFFWFFVCFFGTQVFSLLVNTLKKIPRVSENLYFVNIGKSRVSALPKKILSHENFKSKQVAHCFQ